MTDVCRACAEDVDTLRELARSAYAHYVERIGVEPWPMREDYAARVAAREVWVLEQDEAIAGFVVLEEKAGTSPTTPGAGTSRPAAAAGTATTGSTSPSGSRAEHRLLAARSV
jgi:hypothetical protein